jgi:hypothetical protein
VVGNHLSADDADRDERGARILTAEARTHLSDIEYFPYHSVSWRSPPHLPSQDYGFGLVQRAINRGAVIVVMRGWERWRAAVPGLNGYPLGYRKPNPRQAVVSRRNLGDEPFDALVSALTGC